MRDKRFFIPYPVDRDSFKTLHITYADVTIYYFGKKKCLVYFVENYDPELYKAMMKEIWSSLANDANETRCKIPDGDGGFKVCHKSCRDCEKNRTGLLDSLDVAKEQTGYEVSDPSTDAFKITTLKVVLESLIEKLRTLKPLYADILNDLYHGLSEEEISIKREKSTGTIGEQVLAACALARKILREE